jgi:hypothetical protein
MRSDPRPKLVALALLCLCAAAALAAPGAMAAKSASLEYRGTLLVEEPDGFTVEGGHERDYGKRKLELSWAATATTTIEANRTAPPEWNFTALSGSALANYEGSPNPLGPNEQPCSATLSRRPGGTATFALVPMGAEESEVGVYARVPASSQLLQSSDEAGDGNCSIEAALEPLGEYEAIGGETEAEASSAGYLEALRLALEPKLVEPATGLWSGPFDISWSRELPAGAGDPYVIQITSSLSVGTPVSTVETPTTGNPTPSNATSESSAATTEATKILGDKIDPAAGTATFRFKSAAKGAHFECELHGKGKAKFKPCTSPTTYRRLKPGHYVFSVRVKSAGKKKSRAASRSFTLKRP